MPATRCAVRGDSAANSPNAPSTCSQAPCRSASVGQVGDRVEVAGVHLARVGDDHRRAGHRRPAARSIAARSTRPTASRAYTSTVSRPCPSICSALRALACTYPPESTGIRGSPASPSAADVDPVPLGPPVGGARQRGEVGERGAGHQRAAPARRAGRTVAAASPARRSPPRVANADEARANAFWSSSEAVQSAASAAGVTPPVTKWKNRGPADGVAAAVPIRSSRSTTAGRAARPSSGSVAAQLGRAARRSRVVDRAVGERGQVGPGGLVDAAQRGVRGGHVEERIGHALTLPPPLRAAQHLQRPQGSAGRQVSAGAGGMRS